MQSKRPRWASSMGLVKSPLQPLAEGFALPVLAPAQAAEGRRCSFNGSLTAPPLRGDQPAIQTYSRGSAAIALSIVTAPELRQLAGIALRQGMYASTAVSARQNKLALWSKLAVAAGFTDPFFLCEGLVLAVCGALKSSGFRSAGSYLSLAKQEHIMRHGHLDMATMLLLTNVCRSLRRGLGPAKQTCELPLLRFLELDDGEAPWSPLGSLFPRRALSIGAHFLLREIELAGIRCHHCCIAPDLCGRKELSLLLPVSKVDPEALGATRTLFCCCSAVSSKELCPVCATELQLEFVLNLVGAESFQNAPLFPNAFGVTAPKHAVTSDIRHAAAILGLPLRWHNGAEKFSGHALRATGAMFTHLPESSYKLSSSSAVGAPTPSCCTRETPR
jgi:hypothetical protein